MRETKIGILGAAGRCQVTFALFCCMCFQGDIAKAYRQLARKWHPDMHKTAVSVRLDRLVWGYCANVVV